MCFQDVLHTGFPVDITSRADHTEAQCSKTMTAKRDILCLFDIDGTLTPSRLVSNAEFVIILYTIEIHNF